MVPKDEISPLEFLRAHPELHHYTDFMGLKGIVESNTLWATHFSYLNDSTEVTLLKEPLINFLMPLALEVNSQISRGVTRQKRRALLSNKNIQGIRSVTSAFVKALFDAAFTATTVDALAEPYIISFCAHSEDQPYEKQNGLLSQWRSYGGDASQRYCIVFDTVAIIELLQREWSKHYWTYMYLDKVIYDKPEVKIDDLFPEFLTLAREAIIRLIQGGGIDFPKTAIDSFLYAAPWFKHQGFYEEQEARIVAIPGKKSMADKLIAADPSFNLHPLKLIHSSLPNATPRPHVALFDSFVANLPIKRVIVGPSRHQKENMTRARSVIGRAISLHPSDTPFIG